MKNRTACKECPWKNKNEHSQKFRQWSEKMKTVSDIPHHKCHMISTDVWGQKSPITDKNICVGKSL